MTDEELKALADKLAAALKPPMKDAPVPAPATGDEPPVKSGVKSTELYITLAPAAIAAIAILGPMLHLTTEQQKTWADNMPAIIAGVAAIVYAVSRTWLKTVAIKNQS